MQRLAHQELLRPTPHSQHLDLLANNASDIDRFCSSSAWIYPAALAFQPHFEHHLIPLPSGYFAFSTGPHPQFGRILTPLEASWGLASPLIAKDPHALARETANFLRDHRQDWDLLWLSGLPLESPLTATLATALATDYSLRLGPTTSRHRAQIGAGFDTYLAGRSARHRKRIRQALRQAADHRLRFEWHRTASTWDEGLTLFERAVAIERASWKGRQGTGFIQKDMHTFYRLMLPRLATEGRLRVCFAYDDERPIAVLFGAIFGQSFRGLQNSFDDRYRDLSLGHAMQAKAIEFLQEEQITLYDLGSSMAYKQSWADHSMTTGSLIAIASPQKEIFL